MTQYRLNLNEEVLEIKNARGIQEQIVQRGLSQYEKHLQQVWFDYKRTNSMIGVDTYHWTVVMLLADGHFVSEVLMKQMTIVLQCLLDVADNDFGDCENVDVELIQAKLKPLLEAGKGI